MISKLIEQLKVKQRKATRQSLLTDDKEIKALYQGKEEAFRIAVTLLREKQIEELQLTRK